MMEKASQIDFSINAYSVAPYQLDVYSLSVHGLNDYVIVCDRFIAQLVHPS